MKTVENLREGVGSQFFFTFLLCNFLRFQFYFESLIMPSSCYSHSTSRVINLCLIVCPAFGL